MHKVLATACPNMYAVTVCMTVHVTRMSISAILPPALAFIAAAAPQFVCTRHTSVMAGASVLSMMMKTSAV